MRIIYRNMQGLRSKQDQLLKELKSSMADIAIVLETFMSDEMINNHSVHGYYGYHRQRVADGSQARGGVAIFIRDDGMFKHEVIYTSPSWAKIESITIKIVSTSGNEELYITGAYAPKQNWVTEEELMIAIPTDRISESAKWIIGADINSHHELWDNLIDQDAHGEQVVEFMIAHDLQCANDPAQPTRSAIARSEVKHSSPDITLVRNIEVTEWITYAGVGSDHNWIKIEIASTKQHTPTKRRYWALAKANWEEYAKILDEKLDELKTKTIVSMTEAMLTAMKAAVPKGSRKNYVPIWSDKMKEAQQVYEAADKAHRESPCEKNFAALNRAKDDQTHVFRAERRKIFWERYQNALKHDDVWRLLRNRQRGPQISTNTRLEHEGKTYITDRQKAEAFARKFARISKRQGPKPMKMPIRSFAIPFTMDELTTSLKKQATGKAVGPDELPVEAVMHMSKKAKMFLLEAMNKSYVTGDVPQIWRRGYIIPLLKKLKSVKEMNSYRPVTLTSQISKIMERMIARRILFAIEPNLHHTQYGFRRGRSTVDALMEIVDEIVRAFDRYEPYDRTDGNGTSYTFQRALTVMIDFTSAFDTIGHRAVLEQLRKLGCGEHELRWVHSFISGRQGSVRVNEVTSAWTNFESGVPQGTVLGPLLFIVAINDLLASLTRAGIKNSAFADDLTLVTRDVSVNKCISLMQKGLDVIDDWTSRSCMTVNLKKTYGILFTHTTNASRFDTYDKELTYKGVVINIHDPSKAPPTMEGSRLLGIHFDRHLLFYQQVKKIKSGIILARQAVRCLSGKEFGAQRKMLCRFHETFARSRALNAVEAFWHLLSDTSQGRICAADREGLRQALGLMPGASEAQLIQESRLTPLDIEIMVRQATYYERCVRLGGNQTARAKRQNPDVSKQNRATQQYYRAPMHECKVATEQILKWAKIDPRSIIRAPLVQFPRLQPWARSNEETVSIHTVLVPGKTKTELSKSQQKQAVEERVKTLEDAGTLEFWTDGSAHPSEQRSGAGGTIYVKKDGIWTFQKAIRQPAGTLACSFTAEALGLKGILEEIKDVVNHAIIGFIDCQSLLVALDANSLHQTDLILEDIWGLLLHISKRNTIILQHVFSHCGVEKNDEVDRMAEEATLLQQQGKPVSFRDAKAVIKAWARAQTKDRARPAEIVRHDIEDNWTRYQQVIASQIRAGAVSFIGHWPRRFNKKMAISCRFCAHQDHMVQSALGSPQPIRNSKQSVTCTTCGHTYADLCKFNRHLDNKGSSKCKTEQRKLFVKAPTVPVAHIDRNPSTGPEETIQHVLECPAARVAGKFKSNHTMDKILFLEELQRYLENNDERNLNQA